MIRYFVDTDLIIEHLVELAVIQRNDESLTPRGEVLSTGTGKVMSTLLPAELTTEARAPIFLLMAQLLYDGTDGSVYALADLQYRASRFVLDIEARRLESLIKSHIDTQLPISEWCRINHEHAARICAAVDKSLQRFVESRSNNVTGSSQHVALVSLVAIRILREPIHSTAVIRLLTEGMSQIAIPAMRDCCARIFRILTVALRETGESH